MTLSPLSDRRALVLFRDLTEEKRLEGVGLDLAIRQNTSGDKFVMMFEGQEIRDRGIAGIRQGGQRVHRLVGRNARRSP